ncbi:MAG: hypothetical protein JF888_12835 [Candidatus Dormibacteraeota bacterium]|uniref:DUF4352 domain-containing protein n=1 Tax=Candidatus Dormiibacter inghamiae TaxID=3127013 RepID=A0A934KJS4_9BACT|nr:hypothetical protein [Candidatus Dormibacteraeota bacterium]MBJ7605799.1 hypothetical protein [Candidatus Dormibacteraeota bacterium]
MRRLLAAGVVAAVVIGVILLALAYRNQSRSSQQPSESGVGEAQGLLGQVGFRIKVSHVTRDLSQAALPAAGGGRHYVGLDVTFYNDSPSQQRADPGDFQLRDPQGGLHSHVGPGPSSGQCAAWRIADLHAKGKESEPPRDQSADQVGPVFGPVGVCFEAGGDPTGPLVLLWNPDVGFLVSGVQVTLP